MQRTKICLWFDGQAEEAANFYTSVFKNSAITHIARNPDNSPVGVQGSVLTVSFNLDGQEYFALNGGNAFQFTEAISVMVNCDSQEEIDYYWSKLSEGGKEVECGWVKDKFGLSWQIIPSKLTELLSSGDVEKSNRIFHAIWKMKKIIIADLENA
ncbi:VOC family protein [Arachidicoccus sp.]|uniref:VOC family protein n=1 Tax=Arachidicoccus sp. TaxID=1872624 RepID=UPI003D204E85